MNQKNKKEKSNQIESEMEDESEDESKNLLENINSQLIYLSNLSTNEEDEEFEISFLKALEKQKRQEEQNSQQMEDDEEIEYEIEYEMGEFEGGGNSEEDLLTSLQTLDLNEPTEIEDLSPNWIEDLPKEVTDIVEGYLDFEDCEDLRNYCELRPKTCASNTNFKTKYKRN